MSVEAPVRKRAALADRKARESLRKAAPVLRRLIDARPDFRPWRPYRSLAVSYLFASEYDGQP